VAGKRKPINHGTYGGYQTHVKRRDVPCDACCRALADYRRRYRNVRRCAPGLGWPLEARRG
jgi:hypothetical protein